MKTLAILLILAVLSMPVIGQFQAVSKLELANNSKAAKIIQLENEIAGLNALAKLAEIRKLEADEEALAAILELQAELLPIRQSEHQGGSN